eukprot:4726820-Pyramimonas_sp.AAC.2
MSMRLIVHHHRLTLACSGASKIVTRALPAKPELAKRGPGSLHERASRARGACPSEITKFLEAMACNHSCLRHISSYRKDDLIKMWTIYSILSSFTPLLCVSQEVIKLLHMVEGRDLVAAARVERTMPTVDGLTHELALRTRSKAGRLASAAAGLKAAAGSMRARLARDATVYAHLTQ